MMNISKNIVLGYRNMFRGRFFISTTWGRRGQVPPSPGTIGTNRQNILVITNKTLMQRYAGVIIDIWVFYKNLQIDPFVA